MSVLVVLTNWRRPCNLPQIISAFRGQTVPVSIVVVDNSPGTGEEVYPNPLFAGADDVWRFRTNLGCPCHFAPAQSIYDCKYVVFCDDDLVPGNRAIEYLLQCAASVQDRFATIGQVGRQFRFRRRRTHYIAKNVVRLRSGMMPCDTTCRAHLVRTDLMHHVAAFRAKLIAQFGVSEVDPLVGMHDDMMLSLGIQLGTGFSTYLTPYEKEPELRLKKSELDDSNAASARPQHRSERNRMIDLAIKVGWKSNWQAAYKFIDPSTIVYGDDEH